MSESEEDSEGENPDYASVSESEGEINERELSEEQRNKQIYNGLISDKLSNILDFDNGKINEREYSIFMSGINKKLQELEFEDTSVNKKLIELELDFKLLLEKFERKIKSLKESQNKNFLNKDEVKELLALEYTIENLNEENGTDLFLDYRKFINLWDQIPSKEQQLIIKAINKKKNIFPIDFPTREKFATDEQYRSASIYFFNRFGEQLFEMFGAFFPGYFDMFLHKEEKEIENNLNLTKPRKGSPDYEEKLLEYYKKGVQYLPGYILKMKTQKIGELFEKIESEKKFTKKGFPITVSVKPPKQSFEEMKQLRLELPIRLKPHQELWQRKLMFIYKILKKFSRNQLIDCIMGATRFKENVSEELKQLRAQGGFKPNKVPFKPKFQEVPEWVPEGGYPRAQGEFKPNKVPFKPKFQEVFKPEREKIPEWEPEGGYPRLTSDYDKLTLKQIEQLILNETMNLDSLNYSRTQMEKENQSGIYVVNWNPEGIINDEEIIKWNKFKTSILDSNKKEFVKILLLNEYRAKLLKKYNINLKYNLAVLSKEINNIIKNIKDLETVKHYKEGEEMNVSRKKYTESLKRQFKQLPPAPQSLPYKLKNDILNEIIQAYRRKLIVEHQKQPYKILDLLELYDLNELNNTMVINDIKVIPNTVYTKIKIYLINELNKLINFEQSKKRLFESIQTISQIMNIPITLTTAKNAIDELISKWKPNFNGEVLMDFYGENLLLKLTNTIDPYKFYKNVREYDAMVRRFTPEEEKTYTRPKTLFEGKWYDVQYLDKDWGTHQPLKQYKSELQKNGRTGQMEVVNKIVEKKGKYPFILRKLQSTTLGKTLDVWTEISPGLVTYSSSFGKKK